MTSLLRPVPARFLKPKTLNSVADVDENYNRISSNVWCIDRPQRDRMQVSERR
jgi:hypothetical protein